MSLSLFESPFDPGAEITSGGCADTYYDIVAANPTAEQQEVLDMVEAGIITQDQADTYLHLLDINA